MDACLFPIPCGLHPFVHVPGTSDMYVGTIDGHIPTSTGTTSAAQYTLLTVAPLGLTPASAMPSGWILLRPPAGWGAGPGPNISNGRWPRDESSACQWTHCPSIYGGGGSERYGSHRCRELRLRRITVSGIVAPGINFKVVKQPVFPAVLPPLGSARFEVCFTPQGDGNFSESMLIQSDASNAPALTVSLVGKGVVVGPAD